MHRLGRAVRAVSVMSLIAVGRCGSGDLGVDEAALVEALAVEIGGGDVSAPHRWFVEDRMIVHPKHGIVLSRSELYESNRVSAEARRRLAAHGYRTCRAGERRVCQEAVAAEDSLSVILAIGDAPSGTDDCEHVPVWVGEMTTDRRPGTQPEFQWTEALSLACVETEEDGSVRIESITRYWIEP